MFSLANKVAIVTGGASYSSMAESNIMEFANIPCAVIPRGPHRVGTRGLDRFASATERPLLLVTLPAPVAIACDPLTESDYAPFAPNHVPEPTKLPVANVSWNNANAYCAWLGQRTGQPWRLPSEAEWEIACRAGTDTPFAFGDALPPEAANYYYNESGERVGPGQRTTAGRYPSNSWGLRDMHGNVSEWCADAWHPSYECASNDGAPRGGAENNARVIRGGSWDLLPRLLRSASRDSLPPTSRRDNLGFRLAVTIPE